MKQGKNEISRLESLRQHILGDTVARVGATSSEDYHNFILSCKEIGASANDNRVLQKLSLAPLVKKPLATINYVPIMKKCLANNNPDAHYIKGIIRYFLLNNSAIGLHHLGIAADAGHKEAIYLYGIILLCTGMFEEGKNYTNQLKWAEDKTMVDSCWEKIKYSLHGIEVTTKECYFISLLNMRPATSCHIRDLENTCANCFYYKQMFRFIFMI